MNITKGTFVNELSAATQRQLKSEVNLVLYAQGLRFPELDEALENAMDSRLGDLENTINIHKYLLQENVIIHGYIDQLVPNDDGEFDNMGSCWFIVPEDWAEQMAKENDWMSLEHFWNEYTYDNTDGWLQAAIDDHVMIGCGVGQMNTNHNILDELTTKADEMYCNVADSGDDPETLDFLDRLTDFLESIGGKVKGLDYIGKSRTGGTK